MSEEIPAILLTDEHLVAGRLATRGRRLLEVLNDNRSEHLHIEDVHISRRENKSAELTSLPEALVRKAHLVMAILGGMTHEAAQTRPFAYVEKRVHRAFLIVSGYEVQGRIHLRTSTDPLTALVHEFGAFVPVTDASLAHAGTGGKSLSARVVLVNRSFVSLLQIGNVLADAATAS